MRDRIRTSHDTFAPALVTIVAVMLSGTAALAQDAARSVQEFNADEEKWRSYATLNLQLTIEGRYSSIARGSLRMRNCDLAFRSADSEGFPRLRGDSDVIQVTGRLEQQGSRFVFLVERLRERPSDLQTLKTRETALDRRTPDGWYELAEWASHRGEFYDDDELRRAADRLTFRAVEIERTALDDDDAAARFALAARLPDLGLPDSLRMELVHEGWRVLYDQEREKETADWSDFAARMKRDLPDSEIPLDAPQPKLQQRYEANPLSVYQNAGESDRRKLHRLFYADVLLKTILADAEDRTGFEIADRIDRDLPERHALAEEHRERALADRLANVGTATRPEMLELAATFRKRDDADRARQTMEEWLTAKRERLAQDDPAGLRQLAEEYRSLLEDEKTAAALLLKAYELSPSPEVAARLEQLGYRQRDGQWLSRSELEDLPEDPLAKAMREGRVTKGMTADQVRTTLGNPTASVRIATSGRISEIWTYGEPGSSRLAIHFLQKTTFDREPPKVIQVSNVPPR
ncbi:MAG: hypothetical protein ACREJB_00825 [Planctomycetaceae bacterium]